MLVFKMVTPDIDREIWNLENCSDLIDRSLSLYGNHSMKYKKYGVQSVHKEYNGEYKLFYTFLHKQVWISYNGVIKYSLLMQ